MLYLVDNNGTYGLTKGQFSATNDKGSTSKKGIPNLMSRLTLSAWLFNLRASFVARSFLATKAAHTVDKGRSETQRYGIYRWISPCVAFNNHVGSTKSYEFTRDHLDTAVNADLILTSPEVTADYEEGAREDVAMPDGST